MSGYLENKENKYERILDILCKYKGIKREELFKLLKDKDCMYLFYLLIRKYECEDLDMISKDFPDINKKNINNKYKKAQEKLFLNRKIRNMYFEAEDIIEKIE